MEVIRHWRKRGKGKKIMEFLLYILIQILGKIFWILLCIVSNGKRRALLSSTKIVKGKKDEKIHFLGITFLKKLNIGEKGELGRGKVEIKCKEGESRRKSNHMERERRVKHPRRPLHLILCFYGILLKLETLNILQILHNCFNFHQS